MNINTRSMKFSQPFDTFWSTTKTATANPLHHEMGTWFLVMKTHDDKANILLL